MIKSFRGRLADTKSHTIRLSTNNGLTGYKIVKFQIMGVTENQSSEGACKIFTTEQAEVTTPTNAVNFDNPTLLAAAIYGDSSASPGNAASTIIFDNMIVNQDIYIAWKDEFNNTINYYVELEQIKLNLNEATVATLKDMRGRE